MGKINGNRFSSFRRFLRNVPAFFHRQYLRLVCLVGLSLLSSVCLGDFTSADSASLVHIRSDVDYLRNNSNDIRNYLYDIEQNGGVTHEKLNAIYRSIGITGDGDSSVIDWLDFIARQYGYGIGSSQNGNIAQDFDTLINGQSTLLTQTDTIETLLQSILDALESQDTGGSGSGSGSTSITQDWLKEDTFQMYYDWMRSALGFEGGSSGSLFDWLDTRFGWNSDAGYTLRSYYYEEGKGNDSPFPLSNSEMQWAVLNGNRWTFTNKTFLEVLIDQMESDIVTTGDGFSALINNQMKSSWNDWYAHTNLVENLRLYLSPNDLPTYNYDSNTGNVTLRDESATGSYEEEVIDTRPVSTNSVDTAVVAITNSTESVETFFNKEEVQQRYISSSLISVGQNYATESSASSASGAWSFGGYTIWDEAALFQKYREILTVSKLEEIRAVMEYLWLLVSILASIYLVKRWANME